MTERKSRVRMIHENRNPAVVLVPERAECSDGVLFYDINDRFIELHTTHFCKVICSFCDRPYQCRGRINTYCFASFGTYTVPKVTSRLKSILHKRKNLIQHEVEIRLFLCGALQAMTDFNYKKVSMILLPSYIFLKLLIHCITDIAVLTEQKINVQDSKCSHLIKRLQFKNKINPKMTYCYD